MLTWFDIHMHFHKLDFVIKKFLNFLKLLVGSTLLNLFMRLNKTLHIKGFLGGVALTSLVF